MGLRKSQIQRPAQRPSAIGRAMGVAQVAGGLMSGGSGLLAVPGGVSRAAGGESPGLKKLAGVSDIAGQVSDLSKQKPPAPSKGFEKMRKRAQVDASKMSQGDQQVLQTLGQAEAFLNEYQAQNPELANQFRKPIFEAMMEASRRIKSGVPLSGEVA